LEINKKKQPLIHTKVITSNKIFCEQPLLSKLGLEDVVPKSWVEWL
jgi:hypothetical protein